MIKINKPLEHSLAVAIRKTKTVPRRLPRRLVSGLSNEGQFVTDVIYSVWAYVHNAQAPYYQQKEPGRYPFNKLTVAHAEKARKHWDNMFAKIVPSKQKEAQGAYDQTRAKLTMIRAFIKQQNGGE